MDKSSKSATISQLINQLEEIQKGYGDIEVVLSGDPEGNNFGTISNQLEWSTGVEKSKGQKVLVLYPEQQFTDF